MPQSLAQFYAHLVFSTRDREPIIRPVTYEPLRSYLGGILRDLDSPILAAGVVRDHVHLLYRHSKNVALAKLVETVKVGSSKWMKDQGADYSGFYWQSGYGAFSVSASRLDAVRRYILHQASHHAKVSFQDEFRRFLQECRVDYDERYVWD